MDTPIKEIAQAAPKSNWRGVAVCQLLALAGLALVAFAAMMGYFKPAVAAALGLVSAAFVIMKPSLIPYMFIASLFTVFNIFSSGWMLSVQLVDAAFLMLALSLVATGKFNLAAALSKQRTLIKIMCLFLLWAVVGYVVNFYDHESAERATSAFYLFKLAMLVAAVVLFSHSDWREHRNKFIFIFMLGAFFEIGVALAQVAVKRPQTLLEFKAISGTLGIHPGMLANMMVLATGVGTAAYFMLPEKRHRLFAGGVGLACAALVLYLRASRSSAASLIAAIPPTLVLCYTNRRNIWLVAGLCAVALLAAFTVFPAGGIIGGALGLNSAGGPDMSAYGRMLIWERVYEHALHGPWPQRIFGIGIGTFNTLRFSYHLEAGRFTTGAHNNILHAFVETGAVGMVIFMTIFVNIVWRLAVMGRNGNNGAKCFLFCTLALLISCVTQETFWFNPAFGRFWMTYMFLYLIMFDLNDLKNSYTRRYENGIGSHVGDNQARLVARR